MISVRLNWAAGLHLYLAWNAFMASTFGAPAQSQLLDALWTCANLTSGSSPFGAIFNVQTGAYNNGTLRWVCSTGLYTEALSSYVD